MGKSWKDIVKERTKDANPISTKWQDIVHQRGGVQNFSDYNNDSTEEARLKSMPSPKIKTIAEKPKEKPIASNRAISGRPLNQQTGATMLDATLNTIDKGINAAANTKVGKAIDKAGNAVHNELSKAAKTNIGKALLKKPALVEVNQKLGNSSAALASGVADAATLGLTSLNQDKQTKDFNQKHNTAYRVGNLLGYTLPFGASEKLLSSTGKTLAKNTLKKEVAKGAVQGAVIGGTEAAVKGDSTTKNALNVGLLGGATGAISHGINAIGGLKARPIEDQTIPVKSVESKIEKPNSEIKPSNKKPIIINGKLKFKPEDPKPQSNPLTNMFNDGTISKQKVINHLNSKGGNVLSASDKEIVDVLYPEIVSKHNSMNPSKAIKVLDQPTIDNSLKTKGQELFNSKANKKDILIQSPLVKSDFNGSKPKVKETPSITVNSTESPIKLKLETTNITKSLDDLTKNDLNRVKKQLTTKLNSNQYLEGNKQALQRDLDKVNSVSKEMYGESQPKIPMDNKTDSMNPTGSNTTANIVSGIQKKSINPVQWLHDLYTNVVDVTHPTNMLDSKGNEGTQSAKVMANNTRSAFGVSNYIRGEKLVNRQGQEIGKGLNEILNQVNKKDVKDFNSYLLHKHNISRMAVDKPVFGYDVTSEMSKAEVERLEKLHPEFKNVSNELNQFTKDFTNAWGVDTGMAEQSLMDNLRQRYPDYVPVYRANDSSYVPIDRKGNALSSNNMIKNATGGNANIIDPTDALHSWVDKIVKNAKQNDFYNTILDKVMNNPDEMSKKGITLTKTGEDTLHELGRIQPEDLGKFEQLRSDSTNGNVLTVMRNGKPVSLKISDPRIFKALQELKTGHVSRGLETAARKVTNPFKELITGSNPLFAAKNTFRDIPTAIINSKSNPLTYSKNLVTGIKDMATQNDLYKEYKALGGKSGNLNEGIPSKVNIFKKINDVTETLPRYAEYKSTVKNTGADFSKKMQGLYNANDVTVNFGKYGNTGKTLDAFAPYLNPSIQGVDKFVKQFASPKSAAATILKGATVVTAPVLIADHFNKNNPHYQDLDNRTKDTYILIPDNNNLDENGNAKTFFKIPKAREYGTLFGALSERIMRQLAGEKDAYKGMLGMKGTVYTNFAPVNPLESNIYSPIISLKTNKDFADRSIVPQSMQQRSPKYQYDETTTSLAKALGDKLNWSPKQVDYLLKSYTGILYQLASPALGKGNLLKSVENQFKSDPVYSNQAITDFYDNLDNLSTKAADNNFVNKIPSKILTKDELLRNKFTKAQKQLSDLSKKASKSTNQDEINIFRTRMIDIAKKTNNLVK